MSAVRSTPWLAGSTAMHMLTDRAEVRAGDWVLVIGASSGVGSAAIQIAKQLGGRVIATGSTAASSVTLNNMGADQIAQKTAFTVTKADGGVVEISECPNGHGKIKSPLCCCSDMSCAV